MNQVEVIRTKVRLPIASNGNPVIYYGDNDNDPVIVVTITEEKELSWLGKLITGNKYSYTITISDE